MKQCKFKDLFLSNDGTFGFLTVLVLMMFSSAYGQQGPSVSVSATKTTGNPGDRITFTWKVTGSGAQFILFDGIRTSLKSPYTWTAEPGTHVLNVQLRPTGNRGNHEEKQVVVEISGNKGTFSHPGIYNSQAELDVVRKNVTGSAPHPMKLGWELMRNETSRRETGGMKYSSLNWPSHAVSVVHGKTMSEKWACFEDGRAAYAHALQWVVTGEQKYADKAIEILNSWGHTFTDLTSADHYKYLLNSWVSHTWVAAAEIIRHYKLNGKSAGWKEADIAKFENMARVFERILLQWPGSYGMSNGNNQPTAIVRSRLAVAVFLDDVALFEEATDMLYDPIYTESDIIDFHGHAVNVVGLCIAKDGEGMELNRDFGHGTGTHNALSNAAEILRQQRKHIAPKYDLYEYKVKEDNDKLPRFLLGSEFMADTQLHSPVKLSFRTYDQKNPRKGHYLEMAINYYKNVSDDYSDDDIKFMNEVTKESRKTQGIAYTAPWTILTHARLSAGTKL